MEAVLKETKNFRLEEVCEEHTNRDRGGMHKLSREPQSSCYRCGGSGHNSDYCFHRNKKLQYLRYDGTYCKGSQKGKKNGSKGKMGKMHLVEADSDSQGSPASDEEATGVDIHKVGSKSRYRKLITKLKVNGCDIDFEVDTGAELSTIPLRGRS